MYFDKSFPHDRETDEPIYPYLEQYTTPVKKAERKIIGRELEKSRLMAAMERPELCNAILLAEAGSGKALENLTLIPVCDDRQSVPIKDLKVGDLVFDENGKPTKVLGVFPQGLKRAYRVRFEDDTEVVCNDEHLWNVKGANEVAYKTLTLREIIDKGGDWFVPVQGAIQTEEHNYGCLNLYEMGMNADSATTVEMFSKGNVSQRLFFLQGFVRKHGLIEGQCCFIKTDDLQLTKAIRSLLASLGFRSKVLLCESLGLALRVYGKASAKAELFADVATAVTMFNDDSDALKIESVKDLGTECEMTCIYVDSQSHLFQCSENCIVTHNTALVQGVMLDDDHRYYLEVNLSKMVADNPDPNIMADSLKSLFDDVQCYCSDTAQQIVLFIDEFHQITQLSAAAVEVLKPLLADSGTRGIRVIAATTFIEFREFIAPNQPLVERLQRINLEPPGKDMVVQILRGMARRYGVEHQFYNDSLFEDIYDLTNRYIPANAQPRKSILVLDAMVGWYRYNSRRIDRRLLADVIYESEGVNIAFRVDAAKIKETLDKHVFAQELASTIIQDRLQICVADLNDKTKPMSSFLFTGSTGVGKTEMTKQLAAILFNDSRRLIRFDMTEYANENSLDQFRHELTNRVWERPYSIILLDEIEKACAPVTRILLQVLDDGRLTDENGREVSFINSYIVLTTNAGSEVYKDIAQYAASDTGGGENMKKYQKIIRNSITQTTGENRFPPELLGRIDCIVPFQPLSQNTQKLIVQSKLEKLRTQVKEKHGIDLKIRTRIVDYLVRDNMDTESDAGGARAVISKLESEVVTAVAKCINEHPDAETLFVDYEGTTAYDDKHRLESSAKVIVKPIKAASAARR